MAEKNPVFRFTIPGKPLPCARARFSYATGKAYNAHQSVLDDRKTFVASEFIRQHSSPLQGPLYLKAMFLYKGTKKKWCQPKWTRPDLDNLLKRIMDDMNGVVYADDGQIVSLSDCGKIYGAEDHTVIEIGHFDGHFDGHFLEVFDNVDQA